MELWRLAFVVFALHVAGAHIGNVATRVPEQLHLALDNGRLGVSWMTFDWRELSCIDIDRLFVLDYWVQRCPAGCLAYEHANVTGSLVYAYTSSVCRAAIHSGVIDDQGGFIGITNTGPRDNFSGSTKHGVTSQPLNSAGPTPAFEVVPIKYLGKWWSGTVVQYGDSPRSLVYQVTGEDYIFNPQEALLSQQRPYTVHNAYIELLTLRENSRYFFRVGDKLNGWSSVYSFTTMPFLSSNVPRPIRFLAYGDFGDAKATIMRQLEVESIDSNIDFILHCGDQAYELASNNGVTGDIYMNRMQVIASNIPYMVAPGNHETGDSMPHYLNRFSVITGASTSSVSSNTNRYYSFDVPFAHIVAIDTEAYFDEVEMEYAASQYKWLEMDLEIARNRSQDQWIIVFGHRPLYCTDDSSGCVTQTATLRNGVNTTDNITIGGLEPLFYKYSVDLFLCGHQHDYERMWPVYQSVVTQKNYTNPSATTYVVTGAAGTQEGLKTFSDQYYEDYRAFTGSTYSYSRFTILNSTYLMLEQISHRGEIIDSIFVSQDHHVFSN